MAGSEAAAAPPTLHGLTLILSAMPAGCVFNFQVERTSAGDRISMSDLCRTKLLPASPSLGFRYLSLSRNSVCMIADRPIDLLTLSLHCISGSGILRGRLELTEPGRLVIMTESDVQRLFGNSTWMVRTSSFAATGPPSP